MKITPIASPSNVILKTVRGLHQRSVREKTGQFLIEGPKVLLEALAKGVQLKQIVVSESFLKAGLGELHNANIPAVSVVDDRNFEYLVTTEGPCGIVAVANMPNTHPDKLFEPSSSLVVIANAIQDPGNIGTMIRTALAASASGMILTKGTVDPYNPKVVRSAAGALFSLPILHNVRIEECVPMLKDRGFKVIACDQNAPRLYWEVNLQERIALIFANEGQGFSDPVLELADTTVAIPMNQQSESLNVAISAGIILFGALQQRMTAGK
jgi:RNA methyltransferase, TrmH family